MAEDNGNISPDLQSGESNTPAVDLLAAQLSRAAQNGSLPSFTQGKGVSPSSSVAHEDSHALNSLQEDQSSEGVVHETQIPIPPEPSATKAHGMGGYKLEKPEDVIDKIIESGQKQKERSKTMISDKKKVPWGIIVVALILLGVLAAWSMWPEGSKEDEEVDAPTVATSAAAQSQQGLSTDEIKKLLEEQNRNLLVKISDLETKVADQEKRLAALEKCACKKPSSTKSAKKGSVKSSLVTQGSSNYKPWKEEVVRQQEKACLPPSAPKPAIHKTGHMPLGALPSAFCPNCK